MDEIDLDDFTDVITIYKCKFCLFSASSKQEIANHIKQEHLSKIYSQKAEQIVDTADQHSQDGCNDAKKGSEIVNDEKKIILSNEPDSIDCYNPPQSKDDDLDRSSAATEDKIVDLGVQTWNIVEQAAAVALRGYVDSNRSIDLKQNQLVYEAESDNVAKNSLVNSVNNVNIQVGSPQHLTLEYSDSVSDNRDTEVPAKELYLCSQCNNVFSSMEHCKQHLIDDHDVAVSEDYDDIMQTDGTFVTDASVQTTIQKKPGRKRKSEQRNTEQEQPSEEEDTTFFDSDDDDANQIHENTPESVECSANNKRRIKPPSFLNKDYHYSRRMLRIAKRTKTARVKNTDDQMSEFKLSCTYKCSARFKTQESLKVHLSCHNDTDGTFNCCVCDEKFQSWNLCRLHLYRKHETDTDLFSCPECGYKCHTLAKLHTHNEIHGDQRNYQCEDCGKQFKQMGQLRYHRALTHLVKDNENDLQKKAWYTPKQCPICQRTFTNSQCLNRHLENVHRKENLFNCHFCSYTCTKKHLLIQHVRVHTGEKPFKCDHCNYTSSDHNSLRRHRMRHTGQRPYQCPHCPYSCIQSISLKSHLNSKHPGQEGVYDCHICPFRTIKKAIYDNHLRDHNNGLVKERPKKDKDVEISQPVLKYPKGIKAPSIPGLSDSAAAQLIFSAINMIQEKTSIGDNNKEQSFTIQIPSTQTDDESTIYLSVQPTSPGEIDQIVINNKTHPVSTSDSISYVEPVSNTSDDCQMVPAVGGTVLIQVKEENGETHMLQVNESDIHFETDVAGQNTQIESLAS